MLDTEVDCWVVTTVEGLGEADEFRSLGGLTEEDDDGLPGGSDGVGKLFRTFGFGKAGEAVAG